MYAPNFASERLLTAPYKGCGLSSDWAATDLATLGESSRNPNGRLKLAKARRADLRRGWRAFKAKPDSNGIPDTDDLIRIHAAMFPGLPRPTEVRTRDFDDITAMLDDDMAVSIAVRLSALPASSDMRDYTSADHQVVLYGRTGSKTTRIDPMHRHSLTYTGDSVRLADVRTAARAIAGGLILAWSYPIGEWTDAARLRRRKERRIAAITSEASRTEKRLRARIAALETTMPPSDEVKNARAAGRESAFVQVLGSVSAMRTTPEGD